MHCSHKQVRKKGSVSGKKDGVVLCSTKASGSPGVSAEVQIMISSINVDYCHKSNTRLHICILGYILVLLSWYLKDSKQHLSLKTSVVERTVGKH